MATDHFHHLGIDKKDAYMFSDVQYVVMGGANDRMTKFAEVVSDKFNWENKKIGAHHRFVIWLVGPVLVASHGMGGPSFSILLNEFARLLKYADANAMWFRIGTSGGMGVAAGTLVITSTALNAQFKPYLELTVLGKKIQRPSHFDRDLSQKLLEATQTLGYDGVIGKTMQCDGFYEQQARLDGVICDHTREDKMNFLKRAYQEGVRNMEMECT